MGVCVHVKKAGGYEYLCTCEKCCGCGCLYVKNTVWLKVFGRILKTYGVANGGSVCVYRNGSVSNGVPE